MWRKIRPAVMTILIMHITAVVCIAMLSVVECIVEMPEWIEYALLMLVNVIVGITCGFFLKYFYHRRRYIKITIAIYWITYVVATVLVGIGEEKNVVEIIIIFLLIMFSGCIFH